MLFKFIRCVGLLSVCTNLLFASSQEQNSLTVNNLHHNQTMQPIRGSSSYPEYGSKYVRLTLPILIRYLRNRTCASQDSQYFKNLLPESLNRDFPIAQISRDRSPIFDIIARDFIAEQHAQILSGEEMKLYEFKLIHPDLTTENEVSYNDYSQSPTFNDRQNSYTGYIYEITGKKRSKKDYFPFPLLAKVSVGNKMYIANMQAGKKPWKAKESETYKIKCTFLLEKEEMPNLQSAQNIQFNIIGGYSEFQKWASGFIFFRQCFNDLYLGKVLLADIKRNDMKYKHVMDLVPLLCRVTSFCPTLMQSTELQNREPYVYSHFEKFLHDWSKPLVLVGPPGTGKTTSTSQMIKGALQYDNFVCMVLSPTYNALYAVLQKIIDQGILKEGEAYVIKATTSTPTPDTLKGYVCNREGVIEGTDINAFTTKPRLLLSTSMNTKKLVEVFQRNHAGKYVVSFIEEASKMTIMEYVFAMSCITFYGKRYNTHGPYYYPPVIIGDDHQLQPFSILDNHASISIFSLFVNMNDSERDLLDCPRKVGHTIMNLCSTNEGYKHDTQNKNIH